MSPSRLCWILIAALTTAACTDDDPPALEETVSALDASGCGSEELCRCSVALNQQIQGGLPTPNQAHLAACLGADDPLALFQAASENKAVVARTAKYLADNNPIWIEGYVDLQLQSGNPWMWGHEAFSSTYGAHVVGSMIVALKHARLRNHTALVGKLSRLLRAHWTITALAAIDRNAVRFIAYNAHGTVTANPTAIDRGYSLGLVGQRAYVNGHANSSTDVAADGLLPLFLSIALGHPGRHFPWSLDNSPGYYGGLRAALLVTGGVLDDDGELTTQLASIGNDPTLYGLTVGERGALVSFIASGGATGLDTLRGYLTGIQLGCELTIIRTAGGVLTWWGRSDARVAVCPSGKGGTWAVAKTTTDGTATFLSRALGGVNGNVRAGEVWRSGASVCAAGTPAPPPAPPALPELCLDIPAGAFRHELRIGPSGPVCVAGCTGGTPPPVPWPPRGWIPHEPL